MSDAIKSTNRNGMNVFSWSLTLLVCLIAVLVWGLDYNWSLFGMGAYHVFPLLGLLAFSIMWSQYVSGAINTLLQYDSKQLGAYFQYTGYAVLLLICLHPGLLIIQRFIDGYGLPPESYRSYVDSSLQFALFLGSASLFVFLLYELKRFFDKRSWWRYVTVAVDIAMLAIFYHGLMLGGQLSQNDWFRTLWVFYGLVLIVILVHKYATMVVRYRNRHQA